jgi:membrane protein implicated in regulation of membrane protease activity
MTNPSRYEQGRPDYHDPFGGVGGAPPAQSALTLRLILASFGFIAGVVGAIVFLILGPLWFGVLFAVVALTALIDIIVVVRRKSRGEPG